MGGRLRHARALVSGSCCTSPPTPSFHPGEPGIACQLPSQPPTLGGWGCCRAQLLIAGVPVRLRGLQLLRAASAAGQHPPPRPSGCGWSAAGTAQVHWAPMSLRAQMGPESNGSGGGRTCTNTPTPPLLNLGFWCSPPQVSWH